MLRAEGGTKRRFVLRLTELEVARRQRLTQQQAAETGAAA